MWKIIEYKRFSSVFSFFNINSFNGKDFGSTEKNSAVATWHQICFTDFKQASSNNNNNDNNNRNLYPLWDYTNKCQCIWLTGHSNSLTEIKLIHNRGTNSTAISSKILASNSGYILKG